ncbi:hypothetical protein WA171_001478 [Blastocystis sp. BT1]
MNHGVFLLLEKFFAGTSLKAIAYKMLGSCVLAAPQMSITFASVVLLGGGTWDDVKKKVKQDIPETWVMGNVFWVPINFLQYKWTPLYYRATVGSFAGGTYSSSITSCSILEYISCATVHKTY